MGPTASGKTDIAIALSQIIPCSIISVDSALIYRDMNIGTAKPDAKILAQFPHRLINICDPSESYSAARFVKDAVHEIKNIHAEDKIPLLVGGTMLYFRALQQGLSPLPAANVEIRQKILTEAEQLGWPALHKKLQEIDPQSALRIHQNDPQRLQRALEIYEITGQAPSALYALENENNLNYRLLNIIVAPSDRTILHQRIAIRFQHMLEQGFIDEVAALRSRGDLNINMPSMRAVGYRQVWEYLEGQLNYAEMVERGIIATRQLAKRQLTWLRSWKNAEWFDSLDDVVVEKIFNCIKLFVD